MKDVALDKDTAIDLSGDEISVEQWLEIRQKAALEIDPNTAEVMWSYGFDCDPYATGKYGDLLEEGYPVGRVYFARDPGSNIWVSFDDLYSAVQAALWERHKAKLAFPAGLSFLGLDRAGGDRSGA